MLFHLLYACITFSAFFISQLEKALREVRAENEQMKQSFEAKMVNTDALQSGLEEKSLDVEKKLRVADAKFAEVNIKSLELERKLQEVEGRDSVLRRERISFTAEYDITRNIFTVCIFLELELI